MFVTVDYEIWIFDDLTLVLLLCGMMCMKFNAMD